MIIYIPLEEPVTTTVPVQERRAYRRHTVSQDARLSIDGQEGAANIPVQLVDMSRQGIGLVSPKPLKHGIRVRLETPDVIFFGVVRHSTEVELSYFRTGIEIDTVVSRVNPHTQKPSITDCIPL